LWIEGSELIASSKIIEKAELEGDSIIDYRHLNWINSR
jgi:hypothetical protein